MKYLAVTVVAALIVLWFTPAQRFLPSEYRTRVTAVISERDALAASAVSYVQRGVRIVREKAMELLREELHRSVDSLVR